MKLTEDKDSLVREEAQKTLAELKKIDANSNWLSSLYDRNREVFETEGRLKQVISDPKKSIKTETEIRKSSMKRKTKMETRRTINMGRGDFHKDASI